MVVDIDASTVTANRPSPPGVVSALHAQLFQGDVRFCYFGYLSEETLQALGQTLRDALALEGMEQKPIRTLFTLFVEQAQNIMRYSANLLSGTQDDRTLELRHGLLLLGFENRHPYLTCGNTIARADVDRLQAALAHLHTLDAQGLKALHRRRLKEEPLPGSKGAGVGLIDIARLAPGGFSYQFLELDARFVYFTLTAHF
ncbi:MAG: hypothetical protein HQL66_12190 [Magnetococcales bacterium]|nr:hypothetical protein [Magnetococcales bacterium]